MSPSPVKGTSISSIGQIALSVTDLARATAFYRDVVGLPFLFEAASMSFFDCGGVRLMLSVSDKTESTYSSIIYYKTDDIRSTCEQLKDRRVVFEAPARMIAKMPDHELWMAFFRDSEGNLLGLMSEIR